MESSGSQKMTNDKAIDIAVLKKQLENVSVALTVLGNNLSELSNKIQAIMVELAISNKEREDLRNTVNRIETAVGRLTISFSSRETQSATCEEKCDDLDICFDKLESRVDGLETELGTMKPMFKVIISVFSFFGVSLLGFLWALITGKASIIFN